MVITSTVIYLGIAAGGLTSLGIIWQRGFKPLIDLIKRIHDRLDRWDSMDERITVIETNSRQLTNNGGSHMKDAVDRIERTLNEHLAQSAKVDSETKQEFLNIYKAVAMQQVSPGLVHVAVDNAVKE